MFRTCVIWFMLVWAFAWFGVILPGHTRGVVQLAPDPTATEVQSASANVSPLAASLGTVEAGSCCPVSKRKADDRPRPFMGKCALCDLAAKSMGADAFEITLPFVGLITLLEPPAVFTLSGVQFLVDVHSRGPPTA
jgi:hypothetical protein